MCHAMNMISCARTGLCRLEPKGYGTEGTQPFGFHRSRYRKNFLQNRDRGRGVVNMKFNGEKLRVEFLVITLNPRREKELAMVQILQVTNAKANTLAEFPILGGKKMSFYLGGFTQNSKKTVSPFSRWPGK